MERRATHGETPESRPVWMIFSMFATASSEIWPIFQPIKSGLPECGDQEQTRSFIPTAGSKAEPLIAVKGPQGR